MLDHSAIADLLLNAPEKLPDSFGDRSYGISILFDCQQRPGLCPKLDIQSGSYL